MIVPVQQRRISSSTPMACYSGMFLILRTIEQTYWLSTVWPVRGVDHARKRQGRAAHGKDKDKSGPHGTPPQRRRLRYIGPPRSSAGQYFWSTVSYLARDPRRIDDVDSRGPDHAADAARYALGVELRGRSTGGILGVSDVDGPRVSPRVSRHRSKIPLPCTDSRGTPSFE